MAARFWVGGTGTWDASTTTNWAATSGGGGGQSVPGSGDTVTIDGSSGSGTITVNTNFNIISLTCGAMGMTLDFSANNNSPTMQTFNCSGTGTRTLNMGSGTWNITGNNATVWTTQTTTNLTISIGTSTVNFTYAGGTGTRTLIAGAAFNNLKISAGTDIWNLNSSLTCNDFNWTGFSGTWSTSTTITCKGNFTLGSGMTVTTQSGVISMTAPSGPVSFTSNGVALNRPLTINTTTGVSVILADALNIADSARTLTLTSGVLDAGTNNVNVTCGIFSSSNSNTRTLTMGSGTWTLTGNAATILFMTNDSGMTFTASTAIINCSYPGATGARILNIGVNSVFSGTTIKVSAGTDIVSLQKQSGGTSVYGSLDFTGFTGSLAGGAGTGIGLTGDLTLGSGMTSVDTDNTHGWAFSNTITIQKITSNGVVFNHEISLNSSSAGLTLLDALSMGSTHTITINGGLLNANNKNITTGFFVSSNSNTRSILMGSGTWTLTGTGTVWNITTATGLTFNAGTSTIVANDASASSKTFAFNNMTYNNLRLSGAGSGTFIIGVSTVTTTFNNITVDTPPHTVQVFAGKTLIASSLTWSGTAGNLNTFQSTVNGTPWFILDNNPVSLDYISLQDSAAAGNIPFYAGIHSTNVSLNTNWIFDYPPTSFLADAAIDENGVRTLIAGWNVDGKTIIRVKANPSNHGLKVSDGTTGSDLGPINDLRDQNFHPALMAVSSVDGVTPVVVYADNDGNLLVQST